MLTQTACHGYSQPWGCFLWSGFLSSCSATGLCLVKLMSWYLLVLSLELCDVATRLDGICGTGPLCLAPSACLLFLCVAEGVSGTSQPLFLSPAREERASCECTDIMVPTHGRLWSGVVLVTGPEQSRTAAESLQAASCPLSSHCKGHFGSSKRKRRTSGLLSWPGLVGAGLGRGTAQARVAGRKQLAGSLHHWCLAGSECSRERRGKLPVTQALPCLTAIRCAAFGTCFAHPSPVTSFPELFPIGRAVPEAFLCCTAARVSYRAMGMWCHPLFSWTGGRARKLFHAQGGWRGSIPWEPAVPRESEPCVSHA